LFEGAGGWCASNLEANVNDLFMTDSAQYLATGCMAILGPTVSGVSSVFGNHCTTPRCCEGVVGCPTNQPFAAFFGSKSLVSMHWKLFVGNDPAGGNPHVQPQCFDLAELEHNFAIVAKNSSVSQILVGPKDYKKHGGCGSYSVAGGAISNSYFSAGKGKKYIYAFVIDNLGIWGYRWRPDQFSTSPWRGLDEKTAAARLDDPAPTYTPDADSAEVQTPCESNEKFCVRFQPGAPGDKACLRSMPENINGRPFHDIVQAAKEGKGKNWWDLFADTKQNEDKNYPPTILSGPFVPRTNPCSGSNCP